MSNLFRAATQAIALLLPAVSLASISKEFDPVGPGQAAEATFVIDRTWIRASGAREIPDLLRMIPGLTVININHASDGIAPNGMADNYPRRFEVVVDGVSLHTPAVGAVDWKALPIQIEDIDRIEVFKNPGATAEGSSGIFGSIRIFTLLPEVEQGHTLAGLYGDRGLFGARIRYGFEALGGHGLVTLRSVKEEGDPGWDDNLSRRHFLGSYTRLDKAGDSEFFATIGLGWREADYGGFNPARQSMSRIADLTEEAREQAFVRVRMTEETPRLKGQVFIQGSISDGNQEIEPTAARDEPGADIAYYQDDSYQARRKELKAAYEGIGPRTSWSVGVAGIWDSVLAPTYLDRNDWVDHNIARVSASLDYRLTELTDLTMKGSLDQSSLFATTENGHIGLRQQVTPNHSIRVGLSRGYRLPLIYEEMGASYIILPDGVTKAYRLKAEGGLIPESNTEMEVAVTWSPSIDRIFEARYFRSKLDDWITSYLVPAGDTLSALGPVVVSLANQGEANLEGVDLQGEYRVDTHWRVRASAAYRKLEMRDSTTPDAYLDTVPEYSGALAAILKLPDRWQGSMFYYYSEPFTIYAGADRARLNRFDLKLSKAFRIQQAQAEASVNVLNAFADRDDATPAPMDEPSVYLSLSMHSW